MKTILSLVFTLVIASFTMSNVYSQGAELKFSRVLLVDNNQQSVPVGTVWKITSIYGEALNTCVPVDCVNVGSYGKGIVSGVYVNGTLIPSTIRGFKSSMIMWGNNTCTSSQGSGWDMLCVNKAADPNILPLWLPAGTTLQSVGASAYVSVIEFIVQ